MKCANFEELFSDYMEGHLHAQARSRVASHLEQCAACRADYEAFRYALGELQSLELRATSKGEVAAILAAVDRAEAKPAGIPRSLWTHLAAAAAGALLIWWLWPERVQIEEKLVEVRIEVPVDRPVEVERIVEVPTFVDRPVERIVERVVEIPVERVIEVEHPLQLRMDRFMALSGALAEIVSLAASAAAVPELAALEMPLTVDREPLQTRRHGRPGRASPPSPVRVLRTNDRISLQTHGPLAEVVPALIAMLSDDDDPQLCQVVEAQLTSIRDESGLPAVALPEDNPVRSPAGLATIETLIRGAPEADEAPIEYSASSLWRAWWKSHGEQLASLDARSTI